MGPSLSRERDGLRRRRIAALGGRLAPGGDRALDHRARRRARPASRSPPSAARLRGLPNVAVSTRARVEEVARELDYRADPGGVATGGRSQPRRRRRRAADQLVVLLQRRRRRRGGLRRGRLRPAGPDRAERRRRGARRSTTATRLDRRVDGLIFVEVALDERRTSTTSAAAGSASSPSARRPTRFPSVQRRQRRHRPDRRRPPRSASATGASASSAARPRSPTYFDVPGQRIDGAEQALAAAGLRARSLTSSAPASSPSRAATRPRSSCSPATSRPTAIFALSDEMAFGAVIAARELGLDDPRRRVARRRRRSRGRRGDRPDDRAPARRRARGARRPRAAAPARRRRPTRPIEHRVGDVELVVRASTGPR